MSRPPKVRTFASSPFIMVVTTYKERPARRARPPSSAMRLGLSRAERHAEYMIAADESGTGAVPDMIGAAPDMIEVMRAYRSRRGGR